MNIAQCEGINQVHRRLRDGNVSFNLKTYKCKTKYEYNGHLTRHLDCPSAPLGEVEPVRLGLVLGGDVGLDLVLGDLLGLVLKCRLEEEFLGVGDVSRGRGQTGLKSCGCRKSVMAAGVGKH